jgi:hypothetical protein
MRSELFQPSISGEARLLLLIDGFSSPNKTLEGRTKLAKLDFLLRYPSYLSRALSVRAPNRKLTVPLAELDTIESRMVRFRYGPWDPAYFALLGKLIGHELIEPVSLANGVGYRTTEKGKELAQQLGDTEAWEPIVESIALLRRHFDLSGTTLKTFIYDHFPEVTQARWGEEL